MRRILSAARRSLESKFEMESQDDNDFVRASFEAGWAALHRLTNAQLDEAEDVTARIRAGLLGHIPAASICELRLADERFLRSCRACVQGRRRWTAVIGCSALGAMAGVAIGLFFDPSTFPWIGLFFAAFQSAFYLYLKLDLRRYLQKPIMAFDFRQSGKPHQQRYQGELQ